MGCKLVPSVSPSLPSLPSPSSTYPVRGSGDAFCSKVQGTEEGSPPKTGGNIFAVLLGSGAHLLSILEDQKEAATP